MIILGISGGFSYRLLDMAAAIICDGKIVAACEEERFNRVKHSPHKIPISALNFCLEKAGISLADVDILAYNNNTYIDFESDLRGYLDYKLGEGPKRFLGVNHHLAHAASAYWGSGEKDAAILTYDYSGDAICTGLYRGRDRNIEVIDTMPTQTGNSLGKFYAVFTQYLGFKQLSDEYKVMGMSAYGDRGDLFDFDKFIRIEEESYAINPDIYSSEPRTSLDQAFFNEEYIAQHLIPLRRERDPITDEHKKLAISVQVAFERATLALARRLKRETNSETICLAGGCALNCVANGILHQSKLFKKIYIPPIASDAGGAIGAAYLAAVDAGENVEPLTTGYLGPDYTQAEIENCLDLIKLDYQESSDPAADAAREISRGSLVGWFQGRSEYGPRALGSRSILANPCDDGMRDKINRYVKYRETFRPFAPSVALDAAPRYFKDFCETPFMNIVFDVIDPSLLPAITHVDGTARVQSVAKDESHTLYYKLLQAVEKEIGIPIVLNTSFNINGQPIVNTPHEAIYTFYSSGLDVLYVGNFKLVKPKR
jgi:carbamoyltransferase